MEMQVTLKDGVVSMEVRCPSNAHRDLLFHVLRSSAEELKHSADFDAHPNERFGVQTTLTDKLIQEGLK